MVTCLGEGKSYFKLVKLHLKNWPCVTSCLCGGVGKYIYIYIYIKERIKKQEKNKVVTELMNLSIPQIFEIDDYNKGKKNRWSG